MANVSHILTRKTVSIHTISPDATVLDAALLMNEHQIGSLVVLDQQAIVGIITERDLLRRFIPRRRDPNDILVRDIMTQKVVCCRSHDTIDSARSIMMQQRVRHLPVLDDHDHLLGLISIGDLNAWDLDGQEREIHYLHQYVYGRV